MTSAWRMALFLWAQTAAITTITIPAVKHLEICANKTQPILTGCMFASKVEQLLVVLLVIPTKVAVAWMSVRQAVRVPTMAYQRLIIRVSHRLLLETRVLLAHLLFCAREVTPRTVSSTTLILLSRVILHVMAVATTVDAAVVLFLILLQMDRHATTRGSVWNLHSATVLELV
jgi:hypothetical protein